jgi:predicted PurR-regulated permease PerM
VTQKQQKAITISLVILAGIATVTALYLGRLFLVPIGIALVLNALFRPLVRILQRRGVHPLFSGAAIVLGLLGMLIGLGMLLSWPIRQKISEAPKLYEQARERFERFRQPLAKANKIMKEAQKVVSSAGDEGPASRPASRPTGAEAASPQPGQPAAEKPSPDKEPVRTVQTPAAAPPGFAEGFITTATEIIGGLAEVLLLLFLILGAGGRFYHKFVDSLSQSTTRKTAEEIVHESESVVLRYIGVTALINVGQGTVVGLVMWWLGMPSPLMWALFTFVLEFVPYLGAAVMVVLLSVVALATRDQTWVIVMAPLSYLIITNLQNNLVSPIAYGRRLRLNPPAVLIGVMFWWFVWGIPGAFIAVPILATMKIACDRIEGLKGFGAFIGD